MKRFLISLLLVLTSAAGFAQVLTPVTWEAEVKEVAQDTFDIELKASIIDGWYLYSKNIPDGGPIPTSFDFTFAEEDYKLLGDTQESEAISKFDKVFEMQLATFEVEAAFNQKIVRKHSDAGAIQILAQFQTCNDEKCIFDSKELTVVMPGSEVVIPAGNDISEFDLAQTKALKLDIKNKEIFASPDKNKSGIMVFILGFLGGLIALLTPCVFPMIPLTVSFFTKGAQDKRKGLINALLYGLFIFLIYLLLSVPFHVLDSLNPEILNNVSTNVTLNIIFFLIFVAFAFSFFGYYELTLPSSWSAKMDKKATSIGGGMGIFFMAVTLAIVSFSCTGPILGTLLGSSLSTDGGAWQLSYGMAGFGLALALPFALFAMFPNWLTSLPKSGGWLNTVKVFLGFLELGFALKFLSNADLVNQWGLLLREVFIAIWILVGIGLAAYMFGLIRFPHDGPKGKLSAGRITIGIVSLAFIGYLVPGLFNPPKSDLKLLSGFVPPMFYSVYDRDVNDVHGEYVFDNFDQGIAAAQLLDKPIMIDFTGWACVNCRKMEEQVWIEPQVKKLLHDQFVIISLYVDDRVLLAAQEQFKFV
ncbi:MAG: cytochrome c biogenesis protein CcdA, partial [Gilvibacter sp.]